MACYGSTPGCSGSKKGLWSVYDSYNREIDYLRI